ncbi:acyl-CoA desaturase [Alcanivorax sp. N3-2A]|nr:acyl-CoA desaturase [Alcanivorax sp. N3-2A]
MNEILTFLSQGLLAPGPWTLVLITLGLTHITIVSVTVYLHRYSAHRALELHPALKHFFRFWLWMTTGMGTRAWTAIHRKHHARCDSEEDPHSPQVLGIRKVLREGAELYQAEAVNQETLDKYGAGCPNDWIERNVYEKYTVLGITLMGLINVALFGVIGVTVWAIQMMWIPITAAGIINGIGHYWGYRNFECTDASRNVLPWGILIGGEELHNNHHTYPSSAKLSVRRFEFDMGWAWIRLFEMLHLAKVKKVAPKPIVEAGKPSVDLDTLRALMQHRFQVMAHYRRTVIKPVFNQEKARACDATRGLYHRAHKLLHRDQRFFKHRHKHRLATLTAHNHTLATIYDYRLRLQEIWSQTSRNSSEMLDALAQWCRDAEESGIHALQDFVNTLKGYQVAKVRV